MILNIVTFEYTKNLKCCVADCSEERVFSKRERREIRPNPSFLNPSNLKWANASLGISASKNGQSNLTLSYNDDGGESKIPQRLRGQGATLDFGNDGRIGLSVQGMKGATIGTLTYDTNTHGFEPVSFNSNFQNEFNQGQAAENSSENHERNQIEILMKEISLGSKMDKPLFTEREIDAALPRDGKGRIDMENANPEKLLEKLTEPSNLETT